MFESLRDQIVVLYHDHKVAVLTIFGLGFGLGFVLGKLL